MDPTRLNCCVTFNGRLYYLWAEHLGGNDYWPWLGVYDPDTANATYNWKDDYKNFGYLDGTVASVDVHNVAGAHPVINKATPTAIAVYRQRLVVAVEHEVSGTGAIRTELSTHAIENNPYSVWHIIHATGYTQPPTGPLYISSFNSGIRVQNLKVM